MAWDIWIDRELSRQGTQHKLWRALLESTTVAQLRTLTFSLCSDLIDVEALTRQLEMESAPDLTQWIGRMATRSQALLDAMTGPNGARSSTCWRPRRLMKRVQDGGPDSIASFDSTERAWLEKNLRSRKRLGRT